MSVILTKGQSISLEKEFGQTLSKVVMGLGWDAVKVSEKDKFKPGASTDVDLDASCLMFGEKGNIVDMIWFRQLKSLDGSVTHSGDNRSGDGDGDDEQIIVQLNNIPAGIKNLVFLVNSFSGQDFSQIENASCRILNVEKNQEIAKFDLSNLGFHTAQIMTKIYRSNGEWHMKAIGEVANGRTFNDLLPFITPHL